MTIFAGYYDLDPRPATAEDDLSAQFASLLRKAGATAVEHRARGRLHVAWSDNASFPDPGIAESGGALCLLAGDPIFTPSAKPRDAQAAALAAAAGEPERLLAQCAGTFALLAYRAEDERLVLATDPLGSRPVYYAIQGGRLYFSSCLSVLEGLATLAKSLCAYGLFEHLSFSFNLDGRTPYREIRLLRQGEYLAAPAAGLETRFYHRWDGLAPVELEYPQRVRRVYELFRQAVERRSWRSGQAVAMLSGGLDSRLNAAVLHQLGKGVVGINCAPAGLRFHDEVYAERVAAALGCDFVRVAIPPGPIQWGRLTKAGLEQISAPLDRGAARLVFSGDGGSVGLGLVYYHEDTITLLREGRFDEALELLLRPCVRLPERYLQRRAQAATSRRIRETVRALTEARAAEPGRRLHLFLMENDQRCHLHGYFEHIGGQGHDLHTPFYDADLLRFVIACPVDDFARHRLYHDLLAFLPEPLARIPWQTYPGHLPCPVVEPEEAAESQFSQRGREALQKQFDREAPPMLRIALGRNFPAPPFRRLPVAATALAAAVTGTRRFLYVHRAAERAARLFTVAEKRFHWDLGREA